MADADALVQADRVDIEDAFRSVDRIEKQQVFAVWIAMLVGGWKRMAVCVAGSIAAVALATPASTQNLPRAETVYTLRSWHDGRAGPDNTEAAP